MQVIVNGAISGLEIAVLGLAFQLVYLPTKVFHISLGALYSAAPFMAWECLRQGLPPLPAIFIGIAGTVLLSSAMEAFNHGRLAGRQGSFTAHFVSSLGMYIIIVQFVAVVWGNDPKLLRDSADPVTNIADTVFITNSEWWTVGVCAAMIAVFFGWLRYTDIGLQFRGLADNPGELALRGYNVRRLRYLAFGISGAMVGTTSILIARDTGFWSHGGLSILLLAIVAAIIGGRFSFFGAVIGGLLLGLGRAEVEWYIHAKWADAATFALLVVFLLFRPDGIITRRARLEAEARA